MEVICSILLNEEYIGDIRTKEDTSLAKNTFLCTIRVVKVRKALKLNEDKKGYKSR